MLCRSREGAWIEIRMGANTWQDFSEVAPVRERGLKCKQAQIAKAEAGRSREGAWIEIAGVC